MSFIGISINIWRDTFGTGGVSGGSTPINPLDLLDRANANIQDRAGVNISTRV